MRRVGKTQRWLIEHLAREDHGDECVLWPFSVGSHGYGQSWDYVTVVLAHRVVLESSEAKPEGDYQTAHSCGVRRCVNRNHLRWATPVENAADRKLHGTEVYGPAKRTKLTPSSVREVRRRRAIGESTADLAAEFKMTIDAMGRALSGRSWASVPMDTTTKGMN